MTTSEGYKLETETSGVGTKTLALRFQVSTQTIRNWKDLGMPTLGREGREWRFDLDECRTWVRENVGEDIEARSGGRGGKRNGAGRKPQPIDPAQLSLEGGVEEVGHTAAKAEEVARSLPIELDDIVEEMRSGRMDRVRGQATLEALKAIERRVQLDRDFGKLVEVDKLRDRVAKHLGLVRTKLDGLTSRIGPRVREICGIEDPGVEHRVRVAIDEIVREVLEELAKDPLGESQSDAA